MASAALYQKDKCARHGEFLGGLPDGKSGMMAALYISAESLRLCFYRIRLHQIQIKI